MQEGGPTSCRTVCSAAAARKLLGLRPVRGLLPQAVAQICPARLRSAASPSSDQAVCGFAGQPTSSLARRAVARPGAPASWPWPMAAHGPRRPARTSVPPERPAAAAAPSRL